MRVALVIFVAGLVVVDAPAQSPAEQYRSAHNLWLTHRPDGMTWDDGSPQAEAAIDQMWTAVADEANTFLVAHPSATTKQLERDLIAIDPEKDKRFGPPHKATVVKLKSDLFAVSLTDYTASTVFVLEPAADKPRTIWRLDQAEKQANDTRSLLQAWRSEHADDPCRDKEPKGTYGTCGPLSGGVGLLPPESSGAPRFYIDAVYSQDMGALVLKQTSVWRWDGQQAELLWVNAYNFSLDVDDGVHFRNGELSIIEKRFPRTFTSCNGCFEPTTLRRILVAPDSVHDEGEISRQPELDLIDELFWRILHHQPTSSIASPQVASTLQKPVLKAGETLDNNGSDSFYLGMLNDWSVTHLKNGSQVCFLAGDLDRVDFTIEAARIWVPELSGRSNAATNHAPA